MSESIKLTDNKYWDSSGVSHNKNALSNFLNSSTSCVLARLQNNIILNKTVSYSGIEVPFNGVIYNYGDVFEFRNNRIYCNKDAIVFMSTYVNASIGDGYLLFGGTNGEYNAVSGASLDTGLSGYVYAGAMIMKVSKGNFISVMLGRNSPYSNVTVYDMTRLSIAVVRLL